MSRTTLTSGGRTPGRRTASPTQQTRQLPAPLLPPATRRLLPDAGADASRRTAPPRNAARSPFTAHPHPDLRYAPHPHARLPLPGVQSAALSPRRATP
ncbi:hypothetical protein, partial [Yinghuangia aomiensis]|uniref:hypothetical protein n=1 Tax=Yinghuangia aomiensis TaxID=676205 RepID=UPI0031EBB4C3